MARSKIPNWAGAQMAPNESWAYPIKQSPDHNIEMTKILFKLAAGDLVEVPWIYVVNDARIRRWVNYYINTGQMKYCPNRDYAEVMKEPK